MQRKKILWLSSWYPNKNDRFDGDFIQRHARAAAIYHDVHVIFVTDADIKNLIEEEWNYATGLTEQVIYFKRKTGFAARLRKQITWRNTFHHAIKNYIQKNGLPDCVHVHIPWKTGLIALWMKKKYGTEFIITEHWGIYDAAIEEHSLFKSTLTQRMLKHIYGKAKVFVGVSRFLANGIEAVVGRKADMIIPNVVDTTLFLPKKEKYGKFTFIHVSNMVKLKNVDYILKAFKKVCDASEKDMQLIMVGNRNSEYLKLADQLGLLNTSVFFKGEISYMDVAAEMKRSHCLILFSDSETFSCVTAESLCCGNPVVSSNVGALPELINMTNGILVPAKSEEALSLALIEMTQKYFVLNPNQIAEEACKKFSYSAIAEKFDNLYRTIC